MTEPPFRLLATLTAILFVSSSVLASGAISCTSQGITFSTGQFTSNIPAHLAQYDADDGRGTCYGRETVAIALKQSIPVTDHKGFTVTMGSRLMRPFGSHLTSAWILKLMASTTGAAERHSQLMAMRVALSRCGLSSPNQAKLNWLYNDHDVGAWNFLHSVKGWVSSIYNKMDVEYFCECWSLPD